MTDEQQLTAFATDDSQADKRTGEKMGEKPADPWALYDRLIDGVPHGIAVVDFCVGNNWTYVRTETGMGVAHTVRGGARPRFQGDPRERDLHELAMLVKSWNFVDASLGVAALNAWYATPQKVAALGGSIDEGVHESRDASNPLHGSLKERWMGKNVLVVGHFPGVEAMARQANVTVLERNCNSDQDLPDSACEYLIPFQDFVLMTGTTLSNKTAPRLLELSRNAFSVLVGPSAVPCDALFDFGVDLIGGSVVVDPEPAAFAVRGGSKADWRAGIRKFSIERAG